MINKHIKILYIPLVVFMIFTSDDVRAQIVFGPQNIIENNETVIDNPHYVKHADLDGDGDMDVISTSENLELGWFKNLDGDGTFSEFIPIADDFLPVRELTEGIPVDFDGDNDLDIVVSYDGLGGADERLYLFTNTDGQGTFDDGEHIMLFCCEIEFLKAADMDNDGDQDLVFHNNDKVNWLENIDSQSGEYQRWVLSAITSQYINDIIPVDIDNDQDIDLVVSDGDKIVVLRKEENFLNYTSITLVDGLHSYVGLDVGDINGDLKDDIAFTSFSGSVPSSIGWIENLSTETQINFSSPFIINEHPFGARTIKLGDLDEDDDLDMVLSYPFADKLAYYKNQNALGDFGDEIIVSHAENQIREATIADFNGDGANDILSTTTFNHIHWYKNSGNSFKRLRLTGLSTPNWFEFSDINNDGYFDIISTSVHTQNIAYYKNDGSNQFFFESILDNLNPASNPFAVAVADFDEDNDDDVFATYFNSLVFYENLGGDNGFDTAKIIIDSLVSPRHFGFNDIDGDNDLDIVLIEDGDIVIYEKMGTQEYEFRQRINALNINSFARVIFQDFESDNDVDIIIGAGSTVGDRIKLYTNNGIGDFELDEDIYISSSSMRDHKISDLDNDGDFDIALFYYQNVGWLENDGSNNFTLNTIYSDFDFTFSSLDVGDVDLDGDKDLLVSYFNSSMFSVYDGISWIENLDGQGSFSELIEINTDENDPEMIRLIDIDNDNDLDFFSASLDNHELAWQENFLFAHNLVGTVFYDENENQIKDSTEIGLLHQSVGVDPTAIYSFSDSSGGYRLILEPGDYVIEPVLDQNWILTTDSTNYSVSVTSTITGNLDFGFKPTVSIDSVDAYLASAPTRCGFKVPFWISYQNRGTNFTSGMVKLNLDSLTQTVDFDVMPDSTSGNELFWFFEDINPTYTYNINLVLQMPGVEFINSLLEFNLEVFLLDEFGAYQPHSTYSFLSVLACAYDPNDKLVSTNETNTIGEYILADQELVYMVRFQNTGLDTAFNVTIEDPLDEYLDWTSFNPISASHSYEVELDNSSGLLTYLFKDILLPDSMTNEERSHGFLTYSIRLKDGVLAGDSIINFADIYFDFNPPIRTNTTNNIIYDCSAAITYEINEQNICLYDSIIGNVHDVISGTNFIWELEGIDTIFNDSIALKMNTTGQFNLKIITENQLCIKEAIIPIVVSPLPDVIFGTSLPDTLCLNSSSIQLNDASPIGGLFLGPGVIGDFFVPSEAGPGNHMIFYSFNDPTTDCTGIDSSEVTVFMCTALESLSNQFKLTVNPNPFQDNVTFKIDGFICNDCSIMLIDNLGRVRASSFFLTKNESTINTSNMESGIYYYQIIREGKAVLKKGKLLKL